jgi:hypothetical protein
VPTGDDDLMVLFSLWCYWAFAIDDTHHDTGAANTRTAAIIDLNARIVRTLETPGCNLLGTDPIGAAGADLSAWTRRVTTPVQLRRFADGVRDWLFGAAWMAAHIENRTMPSLSNYAAMRSSINGTLFHTAWLEIANHLHVPDTELHAMPVQALTEAAGFIVSCDNDLFSYAKNDQQEILEPNIVNILIQHERLEPGDAVNTAVAIRDRAMTLFLRLRDHLEPRADHELRTYLTCLNHFIRGAIDWMSTAPRYASPRNRNHFPQPGASWNITWSDTPSHPETTPLDIPSIAWWWDALPLSFGSVKSSV